METRIPRVLVIEDDESISEVVAFHLRKAGLEVAVAADGLIGLRELTSEIPDVLVLDLMLPRIDGWHLIREARDLAPSLPIIVITARTSEHDRVEVLELGADDVISKPFSMRELAARVTAALRRSAVLANGAARKAVTEGDLVIDPERLVVSIAAAPIDLTPLEFKLLWVLADQRGVAVSRDTIYRTVWGGERGHGDRSVDVLVRRLRRKVDEIGGAFTFIQTQHGVGYRFEAMPRAMPGARPTEHPRRDSEDAALLDDGSGIPGTRLRALPR